MEKFFFRDPRSTEGYSNNLVNLLEEGVVEQLASSDRIPFYLGNLDEKPEGEMVFFVIPPEGTESNDQWVWRGWGGPIEFVSSENPEESRGLATYAHTTQEQAKLISERIKSVRHVESSPYPYNHLKPSR